jgi:hypothetical protein
MPYIFAILFGGLAALFLWIALTGFKKGAMPNYRAGATSADRMTEPAGFWINASLYLLTAALMITFAFLNLFGK